ncbi:DUF599 domain-containing protein [Polycladidibacter hongkongensis]|uniref:DUF599 domain-containing protein n=1 Tax=Polycladidibacter hongkongensis TaxID=1647556 RepID=UPI000AE362B1|nr:DUF599 family protein [Pseudovibrio hongkongensis]
MLSSLDFLGLFVFLTAWSGYSWLTSYSKWRHKTLSYMMDSHRHAWMRAMLTRQVRIADTNIAAGLQQGTAFFASASLLAIGGAFTFLNATENAVMLAKRLPVPISTDPVLWELKAFGLILIFAYAFFKFGWAYRLFNYATIVIGSIPEEVSTENQEAIAAADRAARLVTLAGKHFSRGQQALFFAVGYLGWYAGAEAFIASTLFVTAVLLRRQFASRARAAAKIKVKPANLD